MRSNNALAAMRPGAVSGPSRELDPSYTQDYIHIAQSPAHWAGPYQQDREEFTFADLQLDVPLVNQASIPGSTPNAVNLTPQLANSQFSGLTELPAPLPLAVAEGFNSCELPGLMSRQHQAEVDGLLEPSNNLICPYPRPTAGPISEEPPTGTAECEPVSQTDQAQADQRTSSTNVGQRPVDLTALVKALAQDTVAKLYDAVSNEIPDVTVPQRPDRMLHEAARRESQATTGSTMDCGTKHVWNQAQQTSELSSVGRSSNVPRLERHLSILSSGTLEAQLEQTLYALVEDLRIHEASNDERTIGKSAKESENGQQRKDLKCEICNKVFEHRYLVTYVDGLRAFLEGRC